MPSFVADVCSDERETEGEEKRKRKDEKNKKSEDFVMHELQIILLLLDHHIRQLDYLRRERKESNQKKTSSLSLVFLILHHDHNDNNDRRAWFVSDMRSGEQSRHLRQQRRIRKALIANDDDL